MFEAKLAEGLILKKIVESIKDIVTDVNIDISPSGKPTFPKMQLIGIEWFKLKNIYYSEQKMAFIPILVDLS